MVSNGKPLGNMPTAELIQRGVEGDPAERERIRRELNRRPGPLSPLRRARAEVVAELIRFNLRSGLGTHLEAAYSGVRWRSLSRPQVDRALEDLVEAG